MKWYSRFASIDYGDRSSFSFVKTIKFADKLLKRHVDEKYKTLQNLNFNRVHIPEFSYEVTEHELIHHVEFIKGKQLNPISFMHYERLIYEDLVNNKKEWGFHDLNPEDFISEDNTEKLYLVDFESFEKMTLKEKKIYHQKTVQRIVSRLHEHYNWRDIKYLQDKNLRDASLETHIFWK